MMRLGYQFLVPPTVEGPKLGEVKVIASNANITIAQAVLQNTPEVKQTLSSTPQIGSLSVVATEIKLRIGKATTTNLELNKVSVLLRPNIKNAGLNHPTPFFSTVVIDRTANAEEAAKVLIKRIQTQIPILSTLQLIAVPKVLKVSFDLLVQRIEHTVLSMETDTTISLKIEKLLKVATTVASNSNISLQKKIQSSALTASETLTTLAKIEESFLQAKMDATLNVIKNNNLEIDATVKTIKEIQKGRQTSSTDIATLIEVLLIRFSNTQSFMKARSSLAVGPFKSSLPQVKSLPAKLTKKVKGISDFFPYADAGPSGTIEFTGPVLNLFSLQNLVTAGHNFYDGSKNGYQTSYYYGVAFNLPYVSTLHSMPSYDSTIPLNYRSGNTGGSYPGQFYIGGSTQYVQGHFPNTSFLNLYHGPNTRLSSLVLENDGQIYQQDRVLVPNYFWTNRNNASSAIGSRYIVLWVPVQDGASSSQRLSEPFVLDTINMNSSLQLIAGLADLVPASKVRRIENAYSGSGLSYLVITHKNPIPNINLSTFANLGTTLTTATPSFTGRKAFVSVPFSSYIGSNGTNYEKYEELDFYDDSALDTRSTLGPYSHYQSIRYVNENGVPGTEISAQQREAQPSLRTLQGAVQASIGGISAGVVASLANNVNHLRVTYPNLVDTLYDSRPVSGQPRDQGYSKTRTASSEQKTFTKGVIDVIYLNNVIVKGLVKETNLISNSIIAKKLQTNKQSNARSVSETIKLVDKQPKSIATLSSSFISGKKQNSNFVSLGTIFKTAIKGIPEITQLQSEQAKHTTKAIPEFLSLKSAFIKGTVKKELLRTATIEIKHVIKGIPLEIFAKAQTHKDVVKNIPTSFSLLKSSTIRGTLQSSSTKSLSDITKDVIKNSTSITRTSTQQNKDVKAVKGSSSLTLSSTLKGILQESFTITNNNITKDVIKGLHSNSEASVKIRFKVIKARKSFAHTESSLILGQIQKSLASTNNLLNKDIEKNGLQSTMGTTASDIRFSIGLNVPPASLITDSLFIKGLLVNNKIQNITTMNKEVQVNKSSLFRANSKKDIHVSKDISASSTVKNTVIAGRAFLPVERLLVEENMKTAIKKPLLSLSRLVSHKMLYINKTINTNNTRVLTNILPAYGILPISKALIVSLTNVVMIRSVSSSLRTAESTALLLHKPKITSSLVNNTKIIKGILVNSDKLRSTTDTIKYVYKDNRSNVQLDNSINKDVIVLKNSKSKVKSSVIAGYAFLLKHNININSNSTKKTNKALTSEVEFDSSLVDLLPAKGIEDAALIANSGSLYNQGYATDYFLDGYVGEERFW